MESSRSRYSITASRSIFPPTNVEINGNEANVTLVTPEKGVVAHAILMCRRRCPHYPTLCTGLKHTQDNEVKGTLSLGNNPEIALASAICIKQ